MINNINEPAFNVDGSEDDLDLHPSCNDFEIHNL
jgi:hypothetical protein